MSNITQADIDRAMEIINTPFGGNRGMAILSKSNYMYLCGMVQAMTKRIAELEHKLANYSASADGHTHWCPECKMREDRIAELEQELKNQVELHNEWLGTYRIKLDYIEELERKIKILTT